MNLSIFKFEINNFYFKLNSVYFKLNDEMLKYWVGVSGWLDEARAVSRTDFGKNSVHIPTISSDSVSKESCSCSKLTA